MLECLETLASIREDGDYEWGPSMYELVSPVSYQASEGQFWLLQAAFLPDDRARLAWERWRSQVNLEDHLSPGAYRLLPALFRNLHFLGISDPFLAKMRGVARQNWLRNRLMFRALADPLRELSACEVEMMALYGAALALQFSTDYLTPEGCCAFLVRDEQAAVAISRLRDMGWRPGQELPDGHRLRFDDGAGNQIDLHWRLPSLSYQLDLEKEIWGRAVVTHVDGVPLYTMDPADQVLHLCLPHDPPQDRPIFTRAIDVMLVLSAGEVVIDWERTIRLAQDHYLCQPFKETMGYLHANLGPFLPAEAWQRIQALPVSMWERLEHRYNKKRPTSWGKVPELWFNHRRQSVGDHRLTRAVGFARLLQHNWGLRHLWQVPFWVVVRGARKVILLSCFA